MKTTVPTTKIGHRNEKTAFEIKGNAIYQNGPLMQYAKINPKLHLPPYATLLYLYDKHSDKHFYAFRVTKDLWAAEQHFRTLTGITICGYMYRKADLPEDYPPEQLAEELEKAW